MKDTFTCAKVGVGLGLVELLPPSEVTLASPRLLLAYFGNSIGIGSMYCMDVCVCRARVFFCFCFLRLGRLSFPAIGV